MKHRRLAVKTLKEQLRTARAALQWIRDYPKKGKDIRRTDDGYPSEFRYDEFAYKRIINSYRNVARIGLGQRPRSKQ